MLGTMTCLLVQTALYIFFVPRNRCRVVTLEQRARMLLALHRMGTNGMLGGGWAARECTAKVIRN